MRQGAVGVELKISNRQSDSFAVRRNLWVANATDFHQVVNSVLALFLGGNCRQKDQHTRNRSDETLHIIPLNELLNCFWESGFIIALNRLMRIR